MLLAQWKVITVGCLVVLVFLFISVIYAYRVNSKRGPDDPQKRKYPPCALWIAPFTFPIMILIGFTSLVLSTLVAVAILIVFPISLILFRESTNGESFQIKWLLRIGEKLLRINTKLLKIIGLYPSSDF